MQLKQFFKPTVLLACLMLASCGRSNGPAPVVYGGSQPTNANQPQRVAVPQEHVVVAGETLYGIARNYNLPIRALIERNGLQPPYLLRTGQRLSLPALAVHVVQRGETVYGLSRQFGITTSDLSRANDLTAPYTIQVGQQLVIPKAGSGGAGAVGNTSIAAAPVAQTMSNAEEPAATPVTSAPVTKPNAQQASKPQAPTASTATRPTPAPLPQPPSSNSRFIWPVSGKLLSNFGPKAGGLHNDGINVAVPAGTQVLAAESGVVAYASNEMKGFGNLLLIKHDGGWVTAYAHNAKLLVSRGQTVARGQRIALVGATGAVDSPQLHFELRKGSQAVDPLSYLPTQTSQG